MQKWTLPSGRNSLSVCGTCSCGVKRECLSFLSRGTFWPKYRPQDENKFDNDSRCISGLPCYNSGRFPEWERFPIAPDIASSEEHRPVLTNCLVFDRLFLPLNSWENCSVTALSNYCETCVTRSWLTLGTFLSRDKLFLVCSFCFFSVECR